MIMEKRKPSMVGAPGTPLYTMTPMGGAQHAGDSPTVDMGYVHGVNLADELDEVEACRVRRVVADAA